MKTLLAIVAIVVMTLPLKAQTLHEVADLFKVIKTLEDYISFNEQPHKIAVNLKHIYAISRDSILFKQLEKRIGDTLTIVTHAGYGTIYKVLSGNPVDVYKFGYAYLPRQWYTTKEFRKLSRQIIRACRRGQSFQQIKQQYHVADADASGNWSGRGDVVEEFDIAVRSRKKGEIFRVAIPSRDWYFIVKKMEDNTRTEEILALVSYFGPK